MEVPGLPLQASPYRKGGDLAQVQPSSPIWGEGTRDLLESWMGSNHRPTQSPSLPASPWGPAGAYFVWLLEEKPGGLGFRKS